MADWMTVRVELVSGGVVDLGPPPGRMFLVGPAHTFRELVEEVEVDPAELYGERPRLPVPIWGWGSIPDQYGRRSENDTGEDSEDLLK